LEVGTHHLWGEQGVGNCGPGNILRELAKKMDRSKVDVLEMEKV
jgi:hypothetical protein